MICTARQAARRSVGRGRTWAFCRPDAVPRGGYGERYRYCALQVFLRREGRDGRAVLALLGPRGGVLAAACDEHRQALIDWTVRTLTDRYWRARLPRSVDLVSYDDHPVDLEAELALAVLAGGGR